MTLRELGRALVLLLALASSLAFEPCVASAAQPAREAPSRVQLVFVDQPAGDPLLAARIRTLFPPQTLVSSKNSVALDAASVLRPSEPDTLCVWIRFSSPNLVRIYMTAADAGVARYSLRDVTLERGLDDVGGESLAQIVHSAAEALWSGEQHVTVADVARKLVADTSSASNVDRVQASAPARATEGYPAPAFARAVAPAQLAVAPRDARGKVTTDRARALRLGLGASFAARFGTAEGWLSEPGAFIIAQHGAFSLRLDGGMVLPAELALPPVKIRLTGADGGVRAGWQAFGSASVRVRLEAGLGAWAGRWRASVVDREPAVRVSPGQAFLRPYAVASVGLEWVHGPIWFGARAELRGHFARVEYEVEGQNASLSSDYLQPGGLLEFGVSMERASR